MNGRSPPYPLSARFSTSKSARPGALTRCNGPANLVRAPVQRFSAEIGGFPEARRSEARTASAAGTWDEKGLRHARECEARQMTTLGDELDGQAELRDRLPFDDRLWLGTRPSREESALYRNCTDDTEKD